MGKFWIFSEFRYGDDGGRFPGLREVSESEDGIDDLGKGCYGFEWFQRCRSFK